MDKIYILLSIFGIISILFGIVVVYSNPMRIIFGRSRSEGSYVDMCTTIESIFAILFAGITIVFIIIYSYYPFGDRTLYIQIVFLILAVWFPRHRAIRMAMYTTIGVNRWFIWESFDAWRNVYAKYTDAYENKYIHKVYIGNWRIVEWIFIFVIILCGIGTVIKTCRFNEANALLNKYYTQEELSTYSNTEKYRIVCKINEQLANIEMFEQETRERKFKSEVLDLVNSRITGTLE